MRNSFNSNHREEFVIFRTENGDNAGDCARDLAGEGKDLKDKGCSTAQVSWTMDICLGWIFNWIIGF